MAAAVPGDPLSSFLGNLGGGLGKGLGDAIGGNAPMQSGGIADMRSGFDGSGWTVATGRATARGGDRTGGQDLSGAAQGPIGQLRSTAAGLGGIPMLLMVGAFVYFAARGFKL